MIVVDFAEIATTNSRNYNRRTTSSLATPPETFQKVLFFWRLKSSSQTHQEEPIHGTPLRLRRLRGGGGVMLNSSYNSLSRSTTPLGGGAGANRPSPSPKCFGKSTHVLKEDYEREKARWQQKLDEAAQKLNDASINNSELFQIKAELVGFRCHIKWI